MFIEWVLSEEWEIGVGGTIEAEGNRKDLDDLFLEERLKSALSIWAYISIFNQSRNQEN